MISLEDMFFKINECIRNAFEIGAEKYYFNVDKENYIMNALEFIGGLLFTSDSSQENFVAKTFSENFFNFYKEALYVKDDQKNFTQDYFKNQPIEYQIELIKKYMRFIMSSFTNIVIHQTKMLREFDTPRIKAKPIIINEELGKLLEERYPVNLFFCKFPGKSENPDLIILDEYVQVLINNVKFK